MQKSDCPKMKIPCENEISKLPHLAKVAFGARCARRVQPIYKAAWPEATEGHLIAIEKAITFAENNDCTKNHVIYAIYAAGVIADADSSADAARAASNAADAARAAAKIADAARGVRIATDTTRAARITDSLFDSMVSSSASKVAEATSALLVSTVISSTAYAVEAARKYNKKTELNVIQCIRQDFEKLKQAAGEMGWADDHHIPPEFFGAMWPDGQPEAWPNIYCYGNQFDLPLSVPEVE